jgi:hypothetical protein
MYSIMKCLKEQGHVIIAEGVCEVCTPYEQEIKKASFIGI